MAFDPDEFIASPQPAFGGFDPDKFLAAGGAATAPAPAKRNVFQRTGDSIQKYVTTPLKNAAETIIEPALTVGTGMVGQFAGNVAGAAGDIYSRVNGTANIGGDVQRDVSSALTYQPRNPMAKALLETAGEAFDKSKLAGLPVVGNEMQVIASGLPNAAMVARSAVAPDAAKTAALVRDSGNNSRRLANIATAQRNGLTLNPAEVNPSATNKVGAALVGDPALNAGAFAKNQPVVNSIARRELGIPEGTALGPKSYSAVIEKAAKPYEEISAIPKFTTDAEFSKSLDKRSFLTNLPEGERALIKNSAQVDKLVEQANLPEFTGKGAVEIMKQYRSEANAILNNPNAKPKQIALANVQRNIAKQIESMIDRNLVSMDAANPGQGLGDLAQRFREGRATIAKTKTLEKVTDADGNIVATKLKGDKNNTSYTGGLKDINDVASSFPEAFTPPATANPQINVSMGGRLNKALDIASTPVRKTMLSDWYQGKNATGLDARDLRTRLGYDPIHVGPEAPVMAEQLRRVQINKDIPNTALPNLGDPPVIPQSWNEGLQPKPQSTPLPTLPDTVGNGGFAGFDQVPILNPGTSPVKQFALGAEESRAPSTGFDPYAVEGKVRGSLIGLEPPQPIAQALRQPPETVNFPLRTEVWQQPEISAATNEFRLQAQQLKEAIASEPNAFKRGALEAKLLGLENRFGRGASLLGASSAADLYTPNYQTGTRFGVQRTFEPNAEARATAAALRSK